MSHFLKLTETQINSCSQENGTSDTDTAHPVDLIEDRMECLPRPNLPVFIRGCLACNPANLLLARKSCCDNSKCAIHLIATLPILKNVLGQKKIHVDVIFCKPLHKQYLNILVTLSLDQPHPRGVLIAGP